MPRNAEVIRHWQMLLYIDARRSGVSVQELAAHFKVTSRTVWRDLAALQEVGFPLIDEKRDRQTYWLLLSMPLKALNDAGLSVTEACSLYLSRALLVGFTGTPFEPGLTAIISKVEKSLSPRVRSFLKKLPEVVQVKAAPRKHVTAPKHDEFVARVIEAASERRVCKVLYFSVHSNREKDYELHPYNLAYAEGGLYLTAYVPEYRQVRVFAMERVRRVTVLERSFTPVEDLQTEAFGESLGVNRGGKTERIVIDFSSRVANYVRERTWHSSQQVDDAARRLGARDAEGVPRLGAAHLGARLRRPRPRGVAADAGGGDPGAARRRPRRLPAEAGVRCGGHAVSGAAETAPANVASSAQRAEHCPP